jgi:transcriptional repressor NrdR
MVIKKDGARELYDRSKMSAGVYKAFYKRPLSAAQIEALVDEIERGVFELNLDEVDSRKVGEVVMQKIEQADSVAYIRFAAVYQEFRDLKTFDREIKKLIDKSSISK